MGIKFKPSEVKFKKNADGTQERTNVHHYMKSMPKKVLEEYLTANNAKPKVKQKVQNELVRREIEKRNS
jgi:hypothetical protein